MESELAGGAIVVGGCDKDSFAVVTTAEHEQQPIRKQHGLEFMPVDEDELLDEEKIAFAALRAAKNCKARELDTAAYHIAQNRLSFYLSLVSRRQF